MEQTYNILWNKKKKWTCVEAGLDLYFHSNAFLVITFIQLMGGCFKIVTFHLISLSYSLHASPAACDEQADDMIIAQKTWFIHWTCSFFL